MVQEGLFHAGGAEALEQAGQPHRPGEEQGGDGAGPQLPGGGGALPFGEAEEQEQPAAEHQGQQEHVAEVVIYHQGGGQGQEEQAVPPLCTSWEKPRITRGNRQSMSSHTRFW